MDAINNNYSQFAANFVSKLRQTAAPAAVGGADMAQEVSSAAQVRVLESVNKMAYVASHPELADAANLTSEESSELLQSTSEKAVTDGTVCNGKTVLFDLYSILALIQETSQKMRNAERDLRLAQVKSIQSNILAQAEQQRTGALTQLFAGIATTAVTVTMMGVTIKGAVKDVRNQTNAEKAVGLDAMKEQQNLLADEGNPKLTRANLEARRGSTEPALKQEVDQVFEKAGVKETETKVETSANELKQAYGEAETAKGELGKAQTKVTEAEAKVTEAQTKVTEAENKVQLAQGKVKAAKAEVEKQSKAYTEANEHLDRNNPDESFKARDAIGDKWEVAKNDLGKANVELEAAKSSEMTAKQELTAAEQAKQTAQSDLKEAESKKDAAVAKVDEKQKALGAVMDDGSTLRNSNEIASKYESVVAEYQAEFDRLSIKAADEFKTNGAVSPETAQGLRDVGSKLNYARAVQLDACAHMTPSPTLGSDLKSVGVKIHEVTARANALVDPNAALKTQALSQSIQMVTQLGTAIGQAAAGLIDAKRTELQAWQKQSEEELQQMQDLFGNTQQVIQQAIQLFQAITQKESQSIEEIINGIRA